MSSPSPVRARTTRTRRRLRYVAAAASAVLAGSASGAAAEFTSVTTNAGNSVTTGADTIGPGIARATVAKAPAGSPAGRVRAGVGYRVYAAVTDAISAVTGVVADIPASGGGTTTLTSTGGPWTVDGVSYSWRSPVVTATAGMATGTKYDYEVRATDAPGNATAATVPLTVETYRQALSATPGLLAHWRLDVGAVGADEFATGAVGTPLQNSPSTAGHTWTRRSAAGTDAVISTNNGDQGVRRGAANTGTYEYGVAPGADDYAVEADLVVRSLVVGDTARLRARTAVTDLAGYEAGYRHGNNAASRQWYIAESTAAGALTDLNSSAGVVLTAGQPYRLRLEVQGTTIRLLANGVQVATATDPTIARQGRAGIALGGTAAPSATTGLHLNDFAVHPLTTVAASDLEAAARVLTLAGVPAPSGGALVGDTSGSLRFDGSDDRGTLPRPVQDDFSLELWFNSLQGLGAGTPQWYGTAGLVDADVANAANDFGMGLSATGAVVAGVGNPDTSIRSAAGLNNGVWHHVVFTRTRASGALVLYVDGAQVATGTGSTASMNAQAVMSLGQGALGDQRYDGRIDEFAVYATPLTPAQVQDHFQAGHGGTR